MPKIIDDILNVDFGTCRRTFWMHHCNYTNTCYGYNYEECTKNFNKMVEKCMEKHNLQYTKCRMAGYDLDNTWE